jgi:hypothetical protein
MPFLTLSWLF